MSDGYYKYRCKNFYSHNCNNWVWMNNTVCAACIAAGREDSNDCGDSIPVGAVSPIVSADVDDYLLLHTEGAGHISSFTLTERTRAGIKVDITSSTKGLGDLLEPETYYS